ncbi:hypothetical protein N7510_011328 [Penicillium lagena]|uniref:uncharacterized protein n=1 Tax=Penicillium lagena TaxID=94218 RepID=UPI0025420B5B|nr:uncharacterized protein N7510_011328 [Penicillium lagena]KAJ5601794.1 hypothetical protein N7510_011328 [Penicillium lagena]
MMFSMTTLAVAWLLPIAIAAPSGNVQNVDIIIQQIDATSELDIAVVSKKTSQVLGYACSNTLNSGAFSDLPITATLDRNGAGSLAVGDKTYMVHEDPKISGGITCARIYNEAESFTVCSMQVPASLPFTPISDGDMEKCFDSGEIPSLKRAYKSILAQQEGHAMTNVTRKNESPSPHKRDPYGMCDNYDTTWMVGDGNPHQNYLDTQLSVSI